MLLALAAPGAHAEPFDPTRPPADQVALAAEAGPGPDTVWRLDSVLSSPERRVAVINGVRTRVGDRIGGATVLQIDKSSVRLREAGGEFELALHATVKTPAGQRETRR